jgi:hypothetical protein
MAMAMLACKYEGRTFQLKERCRRARRPGVATPLGRVYPRSLLSPLNTYSGSNIRHTLMLHSRHASPHEHVEASSSPAQLYHKYGKKHSFHWPYFTCLYPQLQWTHKIHASLRHRLITVTSIIQILHLRSLDLLLSLSPIRKRLRNHGTLAIVLDLGLKSANHSRLRSPMIHVTFCQTLSFSQILSLMSPYHLLLSSSQTLKQSLLKRALKGAIPRPGHVL